MNSLGNSEDILKRGREEIRRSKGRPSFQVSGQKVGHQTESDNRPQQMQVDMKFASEVPKTMHGDITRAQSSHSASLMYPVASFPLIGVHG